LRVAACELIELRTSCYQLGHRMPLTISLKLFLRKMPSLDIRNCVSKFRIFLQNQLFRLGKFGKRQRRELRIQKFDSERESESKLGPGRIQVRGRESCDLKMTTASESKLDTYKI